MQESRVENRESIDILRVNRVKVDGSKLLLLKQFGQNLPIKLHMNNIEQCNTEHMGKLTKCFRKQEPP